MNTTTIPTFSGNFSIEFDTDDNKFYAMQGVYTMNKKNGQVASYKSLGGAVKFLAGLGVLPIVEEVAEPVVVEETKVAKITEIRGRFVDTLHYYTVVVFSPEKGYSFLGGKEITTKDQALALIPAGTRVTNSEKEFAQWLMEMTDDL